MSSARECPKRTGPLYARAQKVWYVERSGSEVAASILQVGQLHQDGEPTYTIKLKESGKWKEKDVEERSLRAIASSQKRSRDDRDRDDRDSPTKCEDCNGFGQFDKDGKASPAGQHRCKQCRGRGQIGGDGNNCNVCSGAGSFNYTTNGSDGTPKNTPTAEGAYICKLCNGNGKTAKTACLCCRGFGGFQAIKDRDENVKNMIPCIIPESIACKMCDATGAMCNPAREICSTCTGFGRYGSSSLGLLFHHCGYCNGKGFR